MRRVGSLCGVVGAAALLCAGCTTLRAFSIECVEDIEVPRYNCHAGIPVEPVAGIAATVAK